MDLTKFPKTYEANMAWRRRILHEAKRNPLFKKKVKELFYRDVLFAFNAFFFTLDVRRRPWHHQPFCTYDYQDEAILEIAESIKAGEDLVGEKSRDMGFSWMVIGVYTWYWLNPAGGADFLLGSRIEDYVDRKGDMRTLIEKVRYLLYRLPQWLRPKGFRPKMHDNFMKLQNPETGSSITGESNNPNFSTGGRYLSTLFDEFAKWESTDESAWTAAGDATPCRVAISTPSGAAGQYYNLVTDGKTKKIRLHWSLHPVKAQGAYSFWPKTKDLEEEENEELFWRSPWYDRECQRRRPIEIAQELDINYIGAGNPAFDGKAGKRLVFLLRRNKSAVKWFEPSLSEGKLLEVSEPREADGYLAVWEEPKDDQLYALGVDVAEGTEHGDFSVVKILNRMTKSIAGSYFSRIDEVQLASIISMCSKYFTTYDEPWIAIETIGPGLSTFDLCAEMYSVPNLFMMPSYDQASQKVSYKKGFRTGTSSRNKLVGGIREWLLAAEGWADPRLLREMTTFIVNKNKKPEAKSGANDDEVLAFGICLQADAIAPLVEKKKERGVLESGLPEGVFDLATFRKQEEPMTLEERCLATVVTKRAEMDAMREEFYEDTLDSLYG